MADDSRKALTQAQKDAANAWFSKHWKGRKIACPSCTAVGQWEGSNHFVQPVTHFPLGTMVLAGAPAYPLLLVFCQVCGYTMAFNALTMGLYPKDADSAGAGSKAEASDA